MPRPRRIDYPGATHHVFVRGVARSAIAVDEADFQHGLELLELAVERFELECHAWCFLPNHAHLLLTTRLGNLSRAMHWLGTCTAQTFNRRYERVGHLYQGRFGSRPVENDDYFIELARYVPQNPVRAGMTATPEQWPWSSYAATVGKAETPRFLDASAMLALFDTRDAYATWVGEGLVATTLDEAGLPRPPKRAPLARILTDNSNRAIANAHFRHGHSQAAIARHLGLSRSQIRRRLDAAR